MKRKAQLIQNRASSREIVERHGKLGFIDEDGTFILVCSEDLSSNKSGKSAIEAMLERSPRFREQIKDGLLYLSVGSNGNIYCHTTEKGFTALFAPKDLHGDDLTNWAKNKVANQEQRIANWKSGKEKPFSNSGAAKPKLAP